MEMLLIDRSIAYDQLPCVNVFVFVWDPFASRRSTLDGGREETRTFMLECVERQQTDDKGKNLKTA